MFLALIAFVAFITAVIAVARMTGLIERVEELERDRDELSAKLTSLQRAIERWTKTGGSSVAPARDAEPQVKPNPQAPFATPETKTSAGPVELPIIPVPLPEAKAPRPIEPPRKAAVPPVAERPLPQPPRAPVDWESLLGVKGAAWVGGIALITSAIFFARWTIEQGLVTPELRFALMLVAGISALVAAEVGLRKGYERTANPLSGAGIAILYIAFFAGHSRYDLISMPAAFAGMVVVTITACVVAVRYDAFATAALGLIGGFATPVALSTGVDRPIGLFSYILLLNLGLVAVGVNRRWHGLFELGLAGTLIIQIGWFWRFMSPANLLVGLVAFFIFGILYLVIPIVSREEGNERVVRLGAIGGAMPFAFMLFLAGAPVYVDQWPLLVGMIFLLDGAILVVAILRGRAALLLSASIATSLTLTLWASEGLNPSRGGSVMAVSLAAIAIGLFFNLSRRAALRFGSLDDQALRVLDVASLASSAGLGIFALILVGHHRGAPAAPFVLIATALAVSLVERAGHEGRLRGALAVGAMSLAVLVQLWFLSAVTAVTVVGYLALPFLLSALLSAFAIRDTGERADAEAEVAVRLSSWISLFGLYLALAQSEIASGGGVLFLFFAAHVLVITGSVLRSGWTIGLPAMMGASALYLLIWQAAYMKPSQHGMAFLFTAGFYAYFLALPMLVPFARWREAWLPWLTSALSGPAFFLPFYFVYHDSFGTASIGLLPLGLAAVSGLALRVVSARFTESAGDALSARLRLRYLALFSAVALWFIAVAIPLQLDRQWITLGWAIEGMALCWLFGRLPHRGLPIFASILFALVGIRLLLNPEVLSYQERGVPFFNWILYTYGVATACCLIGQSLLRRASDDAVVRRLADGIAFNGLLLGFWLVNLEILDYFSVGPTIALSGHRGYAVKLALSAGWGLYAIILLVVGVAKDLKPLRYLSLAFLMLTVAKVFLYDLSELGGIFRVFSFLGLAVGLILVSLFYQRFVFRKTS